MFKLGVITDEVTQDFRKAIGFANTHNLDAVEIRSVWGKDPFEFDINDIKRIKQELQGHELAVCAISAPFYKCDFYNKKEVAKHIEGLKRCIEWSNILGSKMIRGFDFWNNKKNSTTLEQRAERYVIPSELAKESGITLALEYDPSVHSTNCEKVSELVKCINKDNVKALYDPGNGIYSPDIEIPYPYGYRFIKELFCHVHIKDAVRKNGKTIATAVGCGEVDYYGLFSELIRSNYNGYIILETHYKPDMQIDDELLKLPKGEAFSYLGDIASEECIINLKNIIKCCEGMV